jgi:glutamate-1-semialdehyde aminotransferase
MTPHQEAALRRFIEAWGRKTARSKAMIGDQRAAHADPRNAMGYSASWKELVYPLVVDRSDGAYLWDIDGNRYIDLLNGFGPTFFGHRAPFIMQAIHDQLDRGMELGPQTPLAGEAARLLCELTGLDRAAFACTGSEAVQAAIRIARTSTGRTRIVVFAADYHGNFDEVLVRGIDGAKGPRTVPSALGVPQRAVDDVVVLEYGSDRSLEWIRANAAALAAVMVEPIQTRYPQVQPREFLHEIRRITREVVTGFRCHPGGAQAHYGIEADLVTYGKVLGGGMPIGVVAGRRPFIDVLDGGPWTYGDDSGPTQGVSFFAGTFVRHPLAIAAAHATLTYLRDAGPELQAALNARATDFVARLNDVSRSRGAPLRVDSFASIMFFRSTDPRNALNALFWSFMRDRGVFFLEGYPSYLTLAHSDADLDVVVEAFGQSIDAMFEAHFWRPLTPPPAATPVVAHVERFATAPVAGARLGRAPDGSAAWFVEDPAVPGRYTQVGER